MCGIIGIHSDRPVVERLYNGLICIQHRGQDAAGICTLDNSLDGTGRFHLKKGFGLVRDIFSEKHMVDLSGTMGIGHVRYPTVGGGSGKDAQPFDVNAPYGISLVHNGNVTNFRALKRELFAVNRRHVNSDCDAEAILNVFASELEDLTRERDRHGSLEPEDIYRAVEGVFRRVQGAYSVVAMIAGHGMVAFRDPRGVRPCILGERETDAGNTEYCVASESVVLDLLDFHKTRDLAPGQVIYIDAEGAFHETQLERHEHTPCIFEYVYFARPDSFIDKISVYKTRDRMGRELAEKWRETGIHVDVIIPVPESSCTAATAMAQALGIKYSEGLVKNRYIGRTFIMPGQETREKNIRRKLNAIQVEFDGRDVLLLDDSIVRGSTSRQIVKMAREAGARHVYFLSYSSPVRHPCYYGIDMQTKGEFIANKKDLAGIAEELGADRVIYQEVDAMVRSARAGNDQIQNFCTACFTGEYPAGTVTDEERRAIEDERKAIAATAARVAAG